MKVGVCPGGWVRELLLFSHSVVCDFLWLHGMQPHQASLSFTISWSLLKLMSIESVMPSNHLFLYHPLFLLPLIFPSIRVFSNELALCIRWPKCWSFSLSPSSEYSGLISFRIDWFYSLLPSGFSRGFSGTTIRRHQFFGAQPSLWSNSHIPMLLKISSGPAL